MRTTEPLKDDGRSFIEPQHRLAGVWPAQGRMAVALTQLSEECFAAYRAQICTAQTQQVLDRINAALQKAGTDKSKLLTAPVWLADM